MPAAKPGEIWRVDLGMVAKVRPCLVLTRPPHNDELDVFTVVAHTTSPRGNQWEVPIIKSFWIKMAFLMSNGLLQSLPSNWNANSENFQYQRWIEFLIGSPSDWEFEITTTDSSETSHTAIACCEK